LLWSILFLTPSLLIFGVFTYYALAFNVYLSFTSWNFVAPTKHFVGLQNYRDMVADHRFWTAARNTVYYAGSTVVLSLAAGLIFAVLLNQKVPARNFFRTLIFSPYITTVAAVSLLWIWIFDPNYGLLNYLLSLIGIDGPHWLVSTRWAMPAIIIMSVWRSLGYNAVIFLAGLTAIPRELVEAAEIDGAGRFQVFRHITLPLLSPTTFFLTVTSLIGALQVFDSVAVMTGGGPVTATKVINYYIYEHAFSMFRASYAAAVAMVLFFVVLLLTFLQLRMSRRWVHYQ
jgi:ABC-type sugar transport system permease subunit